MPVEPGPKQEIGYGSVTPPPGGGLLSWASWNPDDSEEVPALRFPLSVKTYHQMRGDSQVDSLTKAITLPVRRLHWAIDPNGARDEVVTQIAADLGLPIQGEAEPPTRGRRRFNHDEHLRHALLALVYGFMFFEQVPDDVNFDLADTWRLRKLAPRMPQTIQQIKVARDGGLEGVLQYGQAATDPRRTRNWAQPDPIPITQLVAYTWEREGANWYGRSMYRPLYKHWLIKDRLIRIDAMKHERYGVGIPTGKAPAGAKDTAVYGQLAQQVKAGPGSGVGLPNGAELYVEGIRGSLTDIVASMRYHDEQMARDFLAMFLQLGQTETGSRALGDSFIGFFEMATESVAKWYATTTTEHVIEDMVDWNWGEDEPSPRLVWWHDEDSPLAVADLVALIDAGVLSVSAEDEAYIRDQHGLPDAIPGATRAGLAVAARRGARVDAHVRRNKATGHFVSHTHPKVTSGDGVGDVGTAWTRLAQARTRRVAARMQTLGVDRIGHRDPTEIEVRAGTNFTTHQVNWEVATEDLVVAWGDVKAAQVQELVAQIQDAVDASDFSALSSIAATPAGAEIIGDHMVSLADEAIKAAKAEAKAQGVTAPAITVADIEPALRARAEAVANLMARGISDAAARQALQRYGADAASGADVAAAVAAHLDELGDSYLNDQLGGALTQAQNSGRSAVFREGPAAAYYASELLDLNTCEACADLDGTEYGSLAEAESDYPTGGYSECFGGPRCRGTLVAVYDEAAAEGD